jgi:CBS domain-containing protein
MTTVRDIMSTELITVDDQTTVAQAATVMGGQHVGSALVMEGDELLGIFTERDIVKALSQDFDAPQTLVTHWMTRQPATVGPNDSSDDALHKMLEGGFRHLPVVEGGRVVGMLSIRDVSRAAASQQEPPSPQP